MLWMWAIGTHKEVSTRATKVKRHREGELYPDALPEIKPCTTSRIASVPEEGLVIEPILMIEIEGKELIFIVDAGAMVSLIQATIRPQCGLVACMLGV